MTHALALRTALARAIAPPATRPVALPAPPLVPGDAGPLLIGRSRRCDFVVADPSVSRRHALLLRGRDGWTLYDLGSTNGTRVNGWRVERAVVQAGDEVELGGATFRFAARG
ncbi:MAG: FHA domain-containing protein [Actinobacteria bacterium]|nr:MAG: FHA domain-containing protein [Actinomycetota bacterium]